MRRAIRITFVVAAISVAGAALAQEMDLMQFADTDTDGKVTMAEFNAFTEQGWGFFAQGADKVKVAELDPMAKPAFAGIAPAADGTVSHESYMAAAPTRFKTADTNGDGWLSKDELNTSMKPPA